MNIMDLSKIRGMSDDELYNYLHALTKRGSNNCSRCGKKANYVINIQNKKKLQQKKLCILCDSCYSDLLDFLECLDIIWD